MNRSKSVILQRNLPFTSTQFKDLKSQVTSQIYLKEKHRYHIQSQQQIKVSKSFTMAPSLLQSPLTKPNIFTKYTIRRDPSPHAAKFVEPCLKVKNPAIHNNMTVLSPQPQSNSLNLMRFKRIIYGIDTHLCRTCQVDKAFKARLFKKKE